MTKPVWEEEWTQDPTVPRYVLASTGRPSRTVMMAMDLNRPADEEGNAARAKLAASAPDMARGIRDVLAQVVESHLPVCGPSVTVEEVIERGQAVLVSPHLLGALLRAARKGGL